MNLRYYLLLAAPPIALVVGGLVVNRKVDTLELLVQEAEYRDAGRMALL